MSLHARIFVQKVCVRNRNATFQENIFVKNASLLLNQFHCSCEKNARGIREPTCCAGWGVFRPNQPLGYGFKIFRLRKTSHSVRNVFMQYFTNCYVFAVHCKPREINTFRYWNQYVPFFFFLFSHLFEVFRLFFKRLIFDGLLSGHLKLRKWQLP